MIRIIATLCSLATGQCHDQTVTSSDMQPLTMTSCLMGMSALAAFMQDFPQYRLGGWRCQIGEKGRGI